MTKSLPWTCSCLLVDVYIRNSPRPYVQALDTAFLHITIRCNDSSNRLQVISLLHEKEPAPKRHVSRDGRVHAMLLLQPRHYDPPETRYMRSLQPQAMRELRRVA